MAGAGRTAKFSCPHVPVFLLCLPWKSASVRPLPILRCPIPQQVAPCTCRLLWEQLRRESLTGRAAADGPVAQAYSPQFFTESPDTVWGQGQERVLRRREGFILLQWCQSRQSKYDPASPLALK